MFIGSGIWVGVRDAQLLPFQVKTSLSLKPATENKYSDPTPLGVISIRAFLLDEVYEKCSDLILCCSNPKGALLLFKHTFVV